MKLENEEGAVLTPAFSTCNKTLAKLVVLAEPGWIVTERKKGVITEYMLLQYVQSGFSPSLNSEEEARRFVESLWTKVNFEFTYDTKTGELLSEKSFTSYYQREVINYYYSEDCAALDFESLSDPSVKKPLQINIAHEGTTTTILLFIIVTDSVDPDLQIHDKLKTIVQDEAFRVFNLADRLHILTSKEEGLDGKLYSISY